MFFVRSPKATMDVANSGQPQSQHNVLIVEFRIWKIFRSFVMIQPLCLRLLSMINYLPKKNKKKQTIRNLHSNFTGATQNTLHNVDLWLSLRSCATRLKSCYTLLIFLSWSDVVAMLTPITWVISQTFWRSFGSTCDSLDDCQLLMRLRYWSDYINCDIIFSTVRIPE